MGLEDELDELVRETDALCGRDDWDGLVSLRQRCLAALERGHQYWPIASLVEYRLALLAPAALAAAQVTGDRGAFALGPLTEVVASGHTWEELAPHLPDGPQRLVVAHERALRGEVLDGVAAADEIEVPLHLASWEPDYALPTYKADRVEAPRPEVITGLFAGSSSEPAPPTSDQTAEDAARALVAVAAEWQSGSEATVAACAVDGDAAGAAAQLGLRDAALLTISPADALAQLAWVGSIRGAHGRRRGGAAGRTSAWWAAACVAGLDEDWPVHTDELRDAISELSWYLLDVGEAAGGWNLRLAVEDPDNGLAWALAVVEDTQADVSG